MGLTQQEIATALAVHLDTLRVRTGFPEAYQNGMNTFTGSLRRAQYKKAMSGDTGMLKFLGANYLGQSERTRQEVSGINGEALKVQHDIRTILNNPTVARSASDFAISLASKSSSNGNSSEQRLVGSDDTPKTAE